MKNNKDYCVFILSYHRAKNILTYKTLRNNGYNDDIYIIVADDDEQLEDYKKIYGDYVITFNRKEIAKKIDICDNFDGLISDVFPRNAIADIAKKIGVKYYLVLDDDYTRFSYRRCFGDILKTIRVRNLGKIILACFEYLKNTPMIDCFSFAQEGDFIGGAEMFEKIGCKRKIMNSFFCRTDTPIKYIGRMNADVNTYLYYGQRGKLLFTINDVSVKQVETQTLKGGTTELYTDNGTYMKSFYSVIVAPNAVKINSIGTSDLRIHHKIDWNKTCPKLIREEFKKK